MKSLYIAILALVLSTQVNAAVNQFDDAFMADSFINEVPYTSVETLSNGTQMQLPVKWWNAQSLWLWGTADLQKTNDILKSMGLSAFDVNGKAMVGICANNYGGGTLGTFAGFFTLVLVNDKNGGGPGVAFWHYYSSYKPNNMFKTQVWGIPTNLGVVETNFLGSHKGFRAKANANEIIEVQLASKDVDALPYEHVPRKALGKVISGNLFRETNFPYESQFDGARLEKKADGTYDTVIPFDAKKGDVLKYGDANNKFVQDMKTVSFVPTNWEYNKNVSGVVHVTKR